MTLSYLPCVLFLNLSRIWSVKLDTKSEEGFTSRIQRHLVVHLFVNIKPVLQKIAIETTGKYLAIELVWIG